MARSSPTARPSPVRPGLLGVAVVAALALGCGGGGAELGASCDGQADCDDALQCLAGLCAPRCASHVECGDGRRCDDGECLDVHSAVGDGCAAEIACGAGQTCALDATDGDGDGRLAATCQARDGASLDQPCTSDAACGIGACSLGRCQLLCGVAGDCPPGRACAELPRALGGAAPRYGVCLPATGVIEHDLPLAAAASTIAIPVPSTARSVALVAVVDDPDVTVGATELRGPDGRFLYRTPDTPEQFFGNAIRHLPGRGVSTLAWPNTPRVTLETGVYRARLAVAFGPGQPAPTLPRVKLLYKVDDSAVLDLHFVFLDLSDHPCAAAWGGGRLDAMRAPVLGPWRDHVAGLADVFGPAGITLGDVTHRDLDDRADLDSVGDERVGELLAQATASTGLTVFVVRSLTPVGVQGMAGHPAPPRTPATAESGVVISADLLCYRDWPSFTRVTANQIASAMGLYRNREPDSASLDPIDDSDAAPDNLMFFGEFGGTELSPGQAEVLRRYPGLR